MKINKYLQVKLINNNVKKVCLGGFDDEELASKAYQVKLNEIA